MSASLRLLIFAFALPLAGLVGGCTMLDPNAWGGPSILTTRPVTPLQHEASGGFSVVVDAPDQPAGPRVFADMKTYARQQGFLRQSPDSATAEQYQLGDIKLDVTYRTEDYRVVAYLHSVGSQLNQRFVDRFYRGFAQQHAAGYGPQAPIVEANYTEDDPNGATRLDVQGGHDHRR